MMELLRFPQPVDRVVPIVHGWSAVYLRSGSVFWCNYEKKVSSWSPPSWTTPATQYAFIKVYKVMDVCAISFFYGLTVSLALVFVPSEVTAVPQPDGAHELEPWELWREHRHFDNKFWFNKETHQVAEFQFFDI